MNLPMKIVIISDTHTLHREYAKKYELPPADVIIHCGDVSGRGEEYYINDFLEWFNSLYQYDHKIFIAGNHDWLFDSYPNIAKELVAKYENVTYLEDSGVNIYGINFWGTPVTPPFFNWAFNRTENKLKDYWELIPTNTDVLITHGPPYTVLDKDRIGQSVGSPSLFYNVIDRIKPKIHCFGHMHNNYGVTSINDTKFINASVLNDRYVIARGPQIIEI